MSWHERLDPERRGSFRGVAFHVERYDTMGGRRWLVHEYPRRDRPYAEDMGRKAREWRLQFFVAGDDYDRQRDELIEALDAPEPGELVHPYLGTFSVVATDPRWSESTSEGGVCTFEVTFIESGAETFPVESVDTQGLVMQAADELEAATIADFMRNWSVEGLLGWSLVSVERDLAAIMRGLENVVGDIAGQVAAAIRLPMNIAGIVMGGYNRLRNAVLEPVRALDLYSGRSVLSSGDSGSGRVRLSPGTPVRAARLMRETGESGNAVQVPIADTPERRQRARNTIAANQLNGRAAAVEAARLVAATDWLSRGDAEAAGADTLALIDAQMMQAEPISDAVYGALVTLRAAVTEDLRRRVIALPGLTAYTPQRTLPALVVAHRLYGDARRADEITVRNRVRHPGALRGGMPLEVLSD